METKQKEPMPGQQPSPEAGPQKPVEILVIQEPYAVAFQQQERPPLAPGQVRVRTLYSGISAGTEMTIYRGSNPYAKKRWNAELKLFVPTTEQPQFYPAPLGYEEVGCVVEVGPDVTEVAVGDCVYGSWSHRTEVVLPARLAAQNRFSSDQDPRHGIFARIGAIALNGILDAQINVGETVAVFGAGVVGLICMGLARLAGARVIAVDIDPVRLRHAERYADEWLSKDVALTIKGESHGRGADVVIEAAGSYDALAEAIRSVAYAGKVISLGFYQSSAGSLFLGEEFHHNRVQIICSQIFTVNPALSYRWDVPRLERTIMDLQAAGKLDLIPLITQEIPFQEAASAYQLLDKYPNHAVQVALTFPEALAETSCGRRTT
ncbi:MAG TPA: zinc-binding dehydrogenase [Chthonomonadaceae bacterium]|nr:zinc-binding dehydrogenase [Chthonomonadaceae bacterium]